jgi:hypothetical protein
MGSRTPDLLIANETLYQLSYDPIQRISNSLQRFMQAANYGRSPNFPRLYRHQVSGSYYGIKKLRGKRKEHRLQSASSDSREDRAAVAEPASQQRESDELE